MGLHWCILLILFSYVSTKEQQQHWDVPLLAVNMNGDSDQDHYSLGLQIGQRFSENIRNVIKNLSDLQPYLGWIRTPKGEEVVSGILQTHRSLFSQYVRELEGLADGAGVNFIDVFTQNILEDLSILYPLDDKDKIGHCSDVQHINNNNNIAFDGHNEDGDEIFKGLSFILQVNYPDGHGWTAYTYPGELSGYAFAFNSHGISITINSLYPTSANENGIAQAFGVRYVLESNSVLDAFSRATKYHWMSGVSFNIGSINQFVNMEVHQGSVSFTQISRNYPGEMPHFNDYLYLNVSQEDIPSEDPRFIRYHQVAPVDTLEKLVNFLGDTTDPEDPVYRDYTLATGIFNWQDLVLNVYTGNPKDNYIVHTFDLPPKD